MGVPTIVAPGAGDLATLGGFGINWKIEGNQAGDRFSVVHHPLAPRALGAPLHRHHREDEYSFVLKGKLGALLGDDVVEADPGTWVFKPRNQWHTFWNAGDGPCRILEIISPGGFEHCFDQMAAAMASPAFDPQQMAELAGHYGLEIRPDSVPELCTAHGLTHPMLQA